MSHILALIWMSQLDSMASSRARLQVRVDTLRAAAEILTYSAQHSRFPKLLSEAMTTVSTDPFSGKPLLYRQEDHGFVVYSVGQDGKFDGGLPNMKRIGRERHLLFRYPLPQYLKQLQPR